MRGRSPARIHDGVIMSIHSTGLGQDEQPHGRGRSASPEPLVVPPREAWRLLGVGNTTGYALLAAGELESITIGRARRITTASIHRYIARRLAQDSANGPAPQPRRRRPPRKNGGAGGAAP
jgi:excisionase family DNA binding protein